MRSRSDAKGCFALALRLTWMVFGHLGLFTVAALVARGDGSPTLVAAFAAMVLGIIAVRYLDVARFGGTTSEGEPATLADWRRFAIGMVLFAATLGALAWLSGTRGWISS